MKKLLIFVLFLISNFYFLFPAVSAQTTYNLQIIFKKGPPIASSQVDGWGYAIAGVGDVNGDSFADIAASYCTLDLANSEWDPNVYIFYGGLAGIDTIPDLLLAPSTGQGTVAMHLAGGDISGDGYSEVIVGTTGLPRVWVYKGGNPMDNTPDYVFFGGRTQLYEFRCVCGHWRCKR
ncbi:MAG: integrin alpha [Candidatus Edwardsbacteria bacterium]